MNKSISVKANDFKHRLRLQKSDMGKWGNLHGFTMRQVSDVVRGINQCTFGNGREIIEKIAEEFPDVIIENQGEHHDT